MLGSNELSGTLSPKISNLENLFELHLDNTLINGTIPEEIGTMNMGEL